jgi:hypothetical protein
MINIPIANVSDETIGLATVMSRDECLSTIISTENSYPREMINQVASLEVVCDNDFVRNREPYQQLILYGRHGSVHEINTRCVVYCIFIFFVIFLLLYVRLEIEYT